MDDHAFLATFEDGSIAPTCLDHRAHIRLAVLYLQSRPFLEACIAMRDGLTRFAATIGKVGLYHETITVAFMSKVNECLFARPDSSWEQLLSDHPELCDSQLLPGLYGARLHGELARRCFILPTPSVIEGASL